jgi:3D (Asp-Asp-Asp) domain-containing protein
VILSPPFRCLFVAVALAASLAAPIVAGELPVPADGQDCVYIVAENGTIPVAPPPETVGELFRQLGFAVPASAFGLDAGAKLSAGQALLLKNVTFVEASFESRVQAPTIFEYEFDPSNIGLSIITQGKEGRERYTVRRFIGPLGTIAEAKTSTIIRKPEPRKVIMRIGVLPGYSPTFEELLEKPILSEALPAPRSFKKKLLMEATAYFPGFASNGKWAGTTAMGYEARPGRVAVDPRIIPLGSRLFVEGYGYCVAVDTGGAIKGNRIDLCYNTSEECFEFGRREVYVYVLD